MLDKNPNTPKAIISAIAEILRESKPDGWVLLGIWNTTEFNGSVSGDQRAVVAALAELNSQVSKQVKGAADILRAAIQDTKDTPS